MTGFIFAINEFIGYFKITAFVFCVQCIGSTFVLSLLPCDVTQWLLVGGRFHSFLLKTSSSLLWLDADSLCQHLYQASCVCATDVVPAKRRDFEDVRWQPWSRTFR